MKNLKEAKIAKREEERDVLTVMINTSFGFLVGLIVLGLFISIPCKADSSQEYWVFGDPRGLSPPKAAV